MEIKLNVYEKRQIVKTYTADAYDIMFGTVEDLFSVIDFDKIQSGTDKEIVVAVAQAIPKAFGLVKPLLKDVFEGITDEEIKKCRVKDIAVALVAIARFSIADIGTVGKSKN